MSFRQKLHLLPAGEGRTDRKVDRGPNSNNSEVGLDSYNNTSIITCLGYYCFLGVDLASLLLQ